MLMVTTASRSLALNFCTLTAKSVLDSLRLVQTCDILSACADVVKRAVKRTPLCCSRVCSLLCGRGLVDMSSSQNKHKAYEKASERLGRKTTEARDAMFRPLAFDHCALSLQPFRDPAM
jgi:hypothetical protein